jgi:hypothetical protein
MRVVKVHASHMRSGNRILVGETRFRVNICSHMVTAFEGAHVQAVRVKICGVKPTHLVSASASVV